MQIPAVGRTGFRQRGGPGSDIRLMAGQWTTPWSNRHVLEDISRGQARSKAIQTRGCIANEEQSQEQTLEEADEEGRTGDGARWAVAGLFLASRNGGGPWECCYSWGVNLEMGSRVLWRHASFPPCPLLRTQSLLATRDCEQCAEPGTRDGTRYPLV